MISNSFLLLASMLAFILLQAGLVQSSEKCSATAYYHKGTKYDAGLYFQHGDKHFPGIYGTFWNDAVNGSSTRNLGLKRFTYGYDKDMVGYIWGDQNAYGFIGSGKQYVFGLQTAMGAIGGLLTPETVTAFVQNMNGKQSDTWNATSGLPNLTSPDGASAATAFKTVMNYTNILASLQNVTEANNDDNVTSDTSKEQKRRRSLQAEVRQNIIMEKRSNDASNDDDDCDGNDDDEDEDDKDDDNKDDDTKQRQIVTANDKTNEHGLKWKNSPHESVVYHAPWKTSKPVYFWGQCDHCDQKTGFDNKGFGSFQNCSLIYQGREYFGKPGSTDSLHTCLVEFDC